jgi:hypothetical protein
VASRAFSLNFWLSSAWRSWMAALVAAQARPEFGDAGQHFVVRGAQFGRVGDAVEVADDAPGAAELLGGDVEHARHVAPFRGEIRLGDFGQGLLGFLQQCVHGGRDVLGADLVEEGEVLEVEEGIGGSAAHGVHFAAGRGDSTARGGKAGWLLR